MTDNKQKRLSLRLTQERYKKLHSIAEAYGETDSAIIRMAINFFMEGK